MKVKLEGMPSHGARSTRKGSGKKVRRVLSGNIVSMSIPARRQISPCKLFDSTTPVSEDKFMKQ